MALTLQYPTDLCDMLDGWISGEYPFVVESMDLLEKSISLEQLSEIASIGDDTFDLGCIPDEAVIDWEKELE